MHYFFGNIIKDSHQVILVEEEAHHCAVVLRLKEGEQIGVLNKKGTVYIAELVSIHKKQCIGKIISENEVLPPKIKFHLVVSPPKNNERLEWLVEKAVELQVESFHFVFSDRCIRKQLNLDRMIKIRDAAMKQSINPYSAEIYSYNNLKTLINMLSNDANTEYFLLHCLENKEKQLLRPELLLQIEKSHIQNVYAFIGPEGDWTIDEIQMIKENLKNVREIDLGKIRLRTETAAIYLASVMKLLY